MEGLLNHYGSILRGVLLGFALLVVSNAYANDRSYLSFDFDALKYRICLHFPNPYYDYNTSSLERIYGSSSAPWGAKVYVKCDNGTVVDHCPAVSASTIGIKDFFKGAGRIYNSEWYDFRGLFGGGPVIRFPGKPVELCVEFGILVRDVTEETPSHLLTGTSAWIPIPKDLQEYLGG